jgi:hypothetical protein
VPKSGGRESFLKLYINKLGQAGEAPEGAGARAQQPGAGKLVRVAEGGKLHRRGGKTHFPHEL